MYDFILDQMVWSYSRLNSYLTCPRMFYLNYIECLESEDNAFAEYGTLIHSVLEKYYKGDLDFYDLVDEYKREYGEIIKHDFPYNSYKDLGESYYESGLNYFEQFEDKYSECEILGIEEAFEIKVAGYPFKGYIDLVVKDAKGIFIVDHKTKAKFKNKKEKDEYLVQLYLYSIYVEEKYGEYPYKLVFNMPRVGIIVEENYDDNSRKLAEKWVKDTIEKIYTDDAFKAEENNFFCNELCNCRELCEVRIT